jgi:D-psicose/D-tagatose/L-ribulose 3-epimerase
MKIYMNLLLWGTFLEEKDFFLLEDLANQGYAGVEIPLFEGEPTHYIKLAAELKRLGLECSTVTCAGNDSNPLAKDVQGRSDALSFLKWAVDMSEILGAKILIGPYYAAHGNFDFDESIEILRERSANVMRDLADYAKEKGLDLGLEFLNRFETFLLNCSQDTEDFVKMIDRDNVGVLYDTHHANIEEGDIIETFSNHSKSFKHIHLSESDRGVLGEGQVKWTDTAQALKSLSYEGVYVIEAFANDVEGFSQAAHVWRPLPCTKLELSKKSLSFAQSLSA